MNLIYDRTEADVAEAKRIRAKLQSGAVLTEAEHTTYFAGLRGCYTVYDWNRVEAAVAELSATLNDAGYSNVTVPHALTLGDTVNLEQWTQYLANVQALIEAFYTVTDTPDLPKASDKLSCAGANAIEKILADIDELIKWMKYSCRKSGTFKSGSNAAHLPLKRSVT